MNRPGRDRVAWTAISVILGLFILCDPATAQEAPGSEPIPEELELTMRLMPEGAELPDAVTKTIELPAAASARGDEAAARGLATANEARTNRLRGLDAAAEARERGLEFGEEMAEQARENREDAGRGDPPVDPPGGPPDDLPSPPGAGAPGDLGDAPGDLGGAPEALGDLPGDRGGPPGDIDIPEPRDPPQH